jgi:hypothetical protein
VGVQEAAAMVNLQELLELLEPLTQVVAVEALEKVPQAAVEVLAQLLSDTQVTYSFTLVELLLILQVLLYTHLHLLAHWLRQLQLLQQLWNLNYGLVVAVELRLVMDMVLVAVDL